MNVKQQTRTPVLFSLLLLLAILGLPGIASAVPPDPVVTPSVLVTRNSPIVVDVGFGTAVTGFELTDIVVTNGTASNLVDTGAATNFTFDVAPTADGDVTIAIPAGVVTANLGGEANTASIPAVVVYDTTGATPVLSSENGSPTNTSPLVVRVNFGENTLGFSSGDLVLSNALVGDVTNIDGSEYLVEMVATDPSAVTQITVELPVSISTDVAGNDNQAATPLVIDYDPVAPAPVFSTASGNPTAVSPIPYTVDFGEPVSGLIEGDFVLTNGVISNLQTTDSQTWTFDISPPTDGEVTISLPINAVTDAANNDNPAGQTSIIYAASAPIPAITSTVGTATNQSSFVVTVNFGQVVSGFDASDLQVVNGTVSNLAPAGDADVFTFDLAPTAEGEVTVDIQANAAQTLALVATGAAPQYSVTYDITPPTPIISTTEPDPTTAATWTMTVDFGEVVTGFAASHLYAGDPIPVLATGANAGLSTVDGQVYTMTFTPNTNTTHVFILQANVVQDLAGNLNTRPPDLLITNNSPIALSGIVYSDAGVTHVGAGTTVSMLINGVKHPTSVLTDSDGVYQFTDADIDGGDVLTFYLDGNTDAGAAIFHSDIDASAGGINIHHSGLNTYGDIDNAMLATSHDGNSELNRIYRTQATANPNVDNTLVDLIPANDITLLITSDSSLLPEADINPDLPAATGFNIVVSGLLDLTAERSEYGFRVIYIPALQAMPEIQTACPLAARS